MKSSSHILVNLLSLLFSILVLVPGKNVSAQALLDVRAQAKAQLHVPWKLLQERLSAIVTQTGSDGSGVSMPIQNQLIQVPYDGEQIAWNLSSGSVSSSFHADSSSMGPAAATVAISGAHVHIVLNSLSVDQVIERNVGGAVVRVHVNADCGPILIDQVGAAANSAFSLVWTGGSPAAQLSSLDLSWAPGSWTFNDFTCSGPSSLDQVVRDGLATSLRDPASLKPYVESYLSSSLQSSIDSSLARLREPFAMGTGNEKVSITVGTLAPTSTGVIGDLTLRTDAKATPLPALPVPSAAVLSALSATQPTLVGGIDVLEFIVGVRLAAQPSAFRVDLQKVPAFHKLMHNRLAQLFVWQDLWHYKSNAPFYLNIANPQSLSLKRSGAAGLSSTLPLSATIQSYRSGQWWTQVSTTGTASATVNLGVSRGTLSYSTTIESLKISSTYGSAYAKRYKKKKSKLPDNIVSKAIVGPQAGLSGSMKWPDIDLAEAGRYRGTSFVWLNASTFSLNFTALTAADLAN